MPNNISVIQGDSSPVTLLTVTGYTDISSANWVGTLRLSTELGGTALVSRALDKATDNTGWLAYLRPAETASLTVGTSYSLTYQIANTVILPQLTRELQSTITIQKQAG